MQTEIESVSVEPVQVMPDKTSIRAGSDEVSFVDQTAQTHFSDLSTSEALSASQSDISERGPWTDDDGDEDQWEDYNSDNYVDKEERENEEEIAFQKRLQAIKSKARPFTEEENQRMEDRVNKILKLSTEKPFRSNPPAVPSSLPEMIVPRRTLR